MPKQQIVPTWLTWNNCNFSTASGIQDARTGQDSPAGGLGLGNYFDATEQEANACSALNIGLLHWGRYRLVKVDSGATAANVKTGTVGFARFGHFVQTVAIGASGSGGIPGTYNISLPPGSGGGSGAVVQVIVGGPGNGVIFASVVQGGMNYTTIPTIPLGVTGVTGGVVLAQLNCSANIVASADQFTLSLQNAGVAFTGGTVFWRMVVFLNSITPGNHGFVQELGLVTGLGDPASATMLPSNSPYISPTKGTWGDQSIRGGIAITVGTNVDALYANCTFKAILTDYLATPCQD